MSTTAQDREFSSLIEGYTTVSIDGSALEAAIEYVGKNFTPDEVFSTKELADWAESNGYIKE